MCALVLTLAITIPGQAPQGEQPQSLQELADRQKKMHDDFLRWRQAATVRAYYSIRATRSANLPTYQLQQALLTWDRCDLATAHGDLVEKLAKIAKGKPDLKTLVEVERDTKLLFEKLMSVSECFDRYDMLEKELQKAESGSKRAQQLTEELVGLKSRAFLNSPEYDKVILKLRDEVKALREGKGFGPLMVLEAEAVEPAARLNGRLAWVTYGNVAELKPGAAQSQLQFADGRRNAADQLELGRKEIATLRHRLERVRDWLKREKLPADRFWEQDAEPVLKALDTHYDELLKSVRSQAESLDKFTPVPAAEIKAVGERANDLQRQLARLVQSLEEFTNVRRDLRELIRVQVKLTEAIEQHRKSLEKVERERPAR